MTIVEPKYPAVIVRLAGGGGNMLAVLSAVSRRLRDEISDAEAVAFQEEAVLGDRRDVLKVCSRWVSVS